MQRTDGRAVDELRTIEMIPNVAEHAAGSVLVSFGKTRVICAATIEDDVPRWMKQQNVKGGWLSAEYSMLPYSTLDRKQRDVVKGKLDGRSSEIQRLIGRSLRAVVDLQKLGQRTLWLDCDVLQADGGTRTASITGACVAAAIAFQRLLAAGKIKSSPLKQYVAAVSCGICDGKALLDLNYPEDKAASVDFNVVMTEDGNFVEVQGSGEESVFSAAQMSEMLALATTGIATLVTIQKNAIAAADRPAQNDLQGLASLFGKR
jgi:ribonuclease PH